MLKARFYIFSLIPPKALELIAVLGVVIIFLYSLYLSNNPKQLITFIGLFAAAAYRIMPSISKMLSALMNMKNSQYSIDILNTYEEEFEKCRYTSQKQTNKLDFNREIVFSNVAYSFPKAIKPTLENISIKIKKGEKIGFIGVSGSGKTTLMNILLRFYTEQNGEIFVDGEKLSNQNIIAWRKLIGYVKQDVFIMNATMKDNITLGEPKPDIDRLNKAIDLASLKDFVITLQDGIETKLGEKGSRLSGGQKQRIGIARALYKNAEILILDEATSALDNDTEREVTEAIYNLSHTNITMFIIAHRITTLKDCDRIYELKDGKITKEHEYRELIKAIV